MRDITIFVSEFMFSIMNGEPLINSPLVFVWVAFWSVVCLTPLFLFVNYGPQKYTPLIFMALFFPGLLMGMGPPVVQMQLLSECEEVESVIATTRIEPTTMVIQQCRYKENFYGEFGEWKIVPKKT